MVGDWDFDSVTSRFADEGAQEEYVRGLKQLTSKPVIGVGRFTSPDTMVRMVRDGVLDFIGAARPCRPGDTPTPPVRCTQTPSMGEEWRRGWHPERIPPSTTDANVLVVGGGPAGLEAGQMLGKRRHAVVLAEQSEALGGRVVREARLPGLAAWIRVVDYRKGQIERLPNVEVALGS